MVVCQLTLNLALQLAAFLLMTLLCQKKNKVLSSKRALWLGSRKHLTVFIAKGWALLFSPNFKAIPSLVSTFPE